MEFEKKFTMIGLDQDLDLTTDFRYRPEIWFGDSTIKKKKKNGNKNVHAYFTFSVVHRASVLWFSECLV